MRHARGAGPALGVRDARLWTLACLLSLAGVVGLTACGSSPPAAQTLTPLFDTPRVSAAREAAPEFMARAEAARGRAQAAEAQGDQDAAADHATEARIWLSAALARMDRVTFEAQRDEHLEAEGVASAHARTLDQEREGVVERQAQLRVAELARQEATRAFTHAEGYEPRRLRRDETENRALYRETTRVLLQRSAALIAAARALGAGTANADALTADADALETRLRALRTERRPETVVTEADTLLGDALALLGQARAGAEVSDQERATLAAAAEERGLRAVRSERGFELHGGALTRPSVAGLRQLAALVNAHPHGGVQILVVGPRSARAQGLRKAAAIRAGLLANDVSEERVQVTELRADVESPAVVLLLPAY